MWSSVICGFWSLVLKLCCVFNQANYAKFSEGHKRFRQRLFDAEMQTKQPSYIVLIRNQALLSSDLDCVWNSTAKYRHLYLTYTQIALHSAAKKSNYPLPPFNVDMETSFLFPSPCSLKTLHYTYSIYLFLAASQRKKNNPLSKIPLPVNWIML